MKKHHLIDAVLWALAAALFFWHFVVPAYTVTGVDYGKHHTAALAIMEGASPYQGEELYLGFNYPLLVGFLYLPLAAFSRDGGEVLWDSLNLVYVLAAAVVMALWLRPRTELAGGTADEPTHRERAFLQRHWPPFVVLLLMACQPAQTVVRAANIEPLNLLLCTVLVALFLHRRDAPAGIVLAFFCLIKLVPVILFLPFFAMQRWRLVAWGAGSLALYGLALLLTGLWRWEVFLYTDVIPKIPHFWLHISYSVHRFVATYFFPQTLDSPDAFRHLVLAVNVVLGLAFMAYLAAWRRFSPRQESALFASALTWLLLFSPLLEINHLLWSFPAIILALKLWAEGLLKTGALAAAIVGACFILAWEFVVQSPTLFQLGVRPIIPAMAALWLYVGTFVAVALRARPDPAASAPEAARPAGAG